MKKLFIPLLVFSLAFVLMNSCSKSSNTPAAPASCSLNVTFNANIKKILDLNCTSCHAPGSGNTPALAKWTYNGTYASAFGNKDNINGQVSAGIMPQSGPLPQIVRDSISCWVSKGAPN